MQNNKERITTSCATTKRDSMLHKKLRIEIEKG